MFFAKIWYYRPPSNPPASDLQGLQGLPTCQPSHPSGTLVCIGQCERQVSPGKGAGPLSAQLLGKANLVAVTPWAVRPVNGANCGAAPSFPRRPTVGCGVARLAQSPHLQDVQPLQWWQELQASQMLQTSTSCQSMDCLIGVKLYCLEKERGGIHSCEWLPYFQFQA